MKFNGFAHAWSDQVKQQTRLNLPREPRFILFHNPKNWTLEKIKTTGKKKDSYLLLPKLNQLILQNGVNMVRQAGRSSDPTLAIANLQREGMTILHPEKHEYLVSYPVVGGVRFESKFVEYEKIGGTLIKHFHQDQYNEWRRELILNGDISTPHQHFIKLMIIENKVLINKYSKLQHDPSGKTKYEKALFIEGKLKELSKQVKEKGIEAYAK